MRLQNILYHVCCNNRESLPDDDDDDDGDDDDDKVIFQYVICKLQIMKLLKY